MYIRYQKVKHEYHDVNLRRLNEFNLVIFEILMRCFLLNINFYFYKFTILYSPNLKLIKQIIRFGFQIEACNAKWYN